MSVRSKRYTANREKVSGEAVGLVEAVGIIKSFDKGGFDESVECVLNLNIDPKQADQMVRGSISLPNGIGRQNKVIAFCQDDKEVETAKEAGAVEAGCDELIEKVSGGWMDFDVAIASVRVMSKVGKLGRILGPQGKMPSPKNGTVTQDVAGAVSEFKAGKAEFRNDAGGNVHLVVGKQSFEETKLAENINAFISHIEKMKPASSKGHYMKGVYLSTTMSPSVSVAL